MLYFDQLGSFCTLHTMDLVIAVKFITNSYPKDYSVGVRLN